MSTPPDAGSEVERSNAVEQCGRVIGYAVKDEEGQVLLVDEHGVPVRRDQAHRKPVPPRFDADGNPQWVV
jgi:hypothetical protein